MILEAANPNSDPLLKISPGSATPSISACLIWQILTPHPPTKGFLSPSGVLHRFLLTHRGCGYQLSPQRNPQEMPNFNFGVQILFLDAHFAPASLKGAVLICSEKTSRSSGFLFFLIAPNHNSCHLKVLYIVR